MRLRFWPPEEDYGDRPPPALAWSPLRLALFAGAAGGGLFALAFAAGSPILGYLTGNINSYGAFSTGKTGQILHLGALLLLLGAAAAAVEGLLWRSLRVWRDGLVLVLIVGLLGLVLALVSGDDELLAGSLVAIPALLILDAGRRRRSGEALAASLLGGGLAALAAVMVMARLDRALASLFQNASFYYGNREPAHGLIVLLTVVAYLLASGALAGLLLFLLAGRAPRPAGDPRATLRRLLAGGLAWLAIGVLVLGGICQAWLFRRSDEWMESIRGGPILAAGGAFFFFLFSLALSSTRRRATPTTATAPVPTLSPAAPEIPAAPIPSLGARLAAAGQDALAAALLAGFGLLLALAAFAPWQRNVVSILAATLFIPAVSVVELLRSGSWRRWLLAVALGGAGAFGGAFLSVAVLHSEAERGFLLAWLVGAGAGLGLAHGLAEQAWGASVAGMLLGQLAGLAACAACRPCASDDQAAWLFFPAAALAGVLYGGLSLVARLWGARLGLAPPGWPAALRPAAGRNPPPVWLVGLKAAGAVLLLLLLLTPEVPFPFPQEPLARGWPIRLTRPFEFFTGAAFLLLGPSFGAVTGLLRLGDRRPAARLLSWASLGHALLGGLLGLLGGWLAWRGLWLEWSPPRRPPFDPGSPAQTFVLLALTLGLLVFVLGLGFALIELLCAPAAPAAPAANARPEALDERPVTRHI